MRTKTIIAAILVMSAVGWLLLAGKGGVKTPAPIQRRFGEAIRLASLSQAPLAIVESVRFDDMPGGELTVDGVRGALLAGTRLQLLDLTDPAAPKVTHDITLPERFRHDGVRFLGASGVIHYIAAGQEGVYPVLAPPGETATVLEEVVPWKGALRLACRGDICVTDKGIWRMKSPFTPIPLLTFDRQTSRFVLFGDWVYWLDGGMLRYAPLDADDVASPETVREVKLPLDRTDYCAAPRIALPDRLAIECDDTVSLLVGAPGEAPRLAQVVKEPLPGHLLRIDERFVTGMTIPGLEGLTLRYRLENEGKATPLYALDFASDMGAYPWTVTGDELMTVKEGTKGVVLKLAGEAPPTVAGTVEVDEAGRLIPVGMSVWRIEPERVTVFKVGP